MKQLVGLCLVEWFLYEKRHVNITSKCGVFGANGSGKSSILDAIQTVMLGASAHRGHGVVFNAQADEKKSTSTRTIRAYCLGQYDVTEGARVRDDSTTYITLVWQDTETRELISTGVWAMGRAWALSKSVSIRKTKFCAGGVPSGKPCPGGWGRTVGTVTVCPSDPSGSLLRHSCPSNSSSVSRCQYCGSDVWTSKRSRTAASCRRV